MENGVKDSSTEKPAMSAEDAATELQLVMGQFEDYCGGTEAMRALAKKCRDYKDGNHYTAEERKTLEKRKQPIITDNKIQDKVDTLMGLEKQQRTDPKAYPRNPEDEGASEAATDALRYVADTADYQQSARKPAVENLIVEGWCYGEVYVDRDSKDRKICMDHIRADRGYHDIRSLRLDFDDKEYAGYFTWMDAAVVKRRWPKAEAVVDGSFSDQATVAGTDTEHEDKPNRYIEVNGSRKRLQVFTHYHRKDGVWMFSRWCKGGFLTAPIESPYHDEDGKPVCTIEVQALYKDSDGNCYGSVQRYLDLMDEHNKRRSKLLHLLNTRRIRARRGALGTDLNKARAELHKPDGVLEIDGKIDDAVVEDNLDMAEGQFKVLQYTDQMLSQTGPNAALAGLSGNISGRAKELDQATGTLPLIPIFDAVDAWEIRLYRKVWLCVRQFWTEQKWIRVTDDERKIKFVALNQPMTVGEVALQKMKGKVPADQYEQLKQQAESDPAAQQPAIGPDGRPIIRNSVARMDVDIIIARTADTVNVQAEQFEIIAKLAESRPEVPFSVIIESSQLRSDMKRRMLDALPGGGDPAQAQAAAAMQQVQAAAQEAQALKAEADTAQAEAQKAAADVKVQQSSLQVMKADLETMRAEISTQRAELATQEAEFRQLKAETMAGAAQDGAAQTGDKADALYQAMNEQLSAVVQSFAQQSQQLLQSAAEQLQAVPQIVMQTVEAQKAPQRVGRRVAIKRGAGGQRAAQVYDTFADGTMQERQVTFQNVDGQLIGDMQEPPPEQTVQ